ncbi:hypothetical protein CEXT_293181 [Caerostris extrusa]|uniref:Uncharacterized protein n=1 Tax=Caerostris extrusa TaxID=172846 RepID=A0AAV4SZE2_CAEEX|nr:hypothetical protein CEXT_293181 [Caerostris extrusa]
MQRFFIDKRPFIGATPPANGDSGPPYLFPNTSDMGSGCALANFSRREIRAALMEAVPCSSGSGLGVREGRGKVLNLGLDEALFDGKKKIGKLLLFYLPNAVW